ncbi:MAG: hydroxyisourate hydrolase [Hyphomicrobiales bacterium]
MTLNKRGKLSTHILDTSLGRPAAGVKISLSHIENEVATEILSTLSNEDGRTDHPLLTDATFRLGTYELKFHVGPYFKNVPHDERTLPFLDIIPVRFTLSEIDHYHVPLLVSPYSYSTYRGS